MHSKKHSAKRQTFQATVYTDYLAEQALVLCELPEPQGSPAALLDTCNKYKWFKINKIAPTEQFEPVKKLEVISSKKDAVHKTAFV